MKIMPLLVITVLLAGCAAPQNKENTVVFEEQPLEVFVREWKARKTVSTGVVNEYLKRKNNETPKTAGIFYQQEDLPLENAKKHGIVEEENGKILTKQSLAKFGGTELLVAVYRMLQERQPLTAALFLKGKDGGFKNIFETKEEGNSFINVTLFSPGKGTGDFVLLEYGDCSCKPTNKVYRLENESVLLEKYSAEGEGLSVLFDDLDNDGVCELIETKNMGYSAELAEEIQKQFGDVNSTVRMMASVVTTVTIHKWDGKEFKKNGELYR